MKLDRISIIINIVVTPQSGHRHVMKMIEVILKT